MIRHFEPLSFPPGLHFILLHADHLPPSLRLVVQQYALSRGFVYRGTSTLPSPAFYRTSGGRENDLRAGRQDSCLQAKQYAASL
ncbi:hypothetical protein JCM8547_001545 [Rhodosporidiobolus lusitaniae]